MRFTWPVVLLLTSIVALKYDKFSLTSYDEDSSLIALIDAASTVIDKFYAQFEFSTVNMITALTRNSAGKDLIVDVILRKHQKFAIRIENHKRNRKSDNIKKRHNVVLLDDIREFRVLNSNTSAGVFSYYGFYVLIFLKGGYADIEETFSALWKKSIDNVDIIFSYGDAVRVWTFFPFGGSICGDTKPRNIGSFINESFSSSFELLFPEKLTNLKDCPITIASFESGFSVIKEILNNGSFKLIGYDMDLIRVLSQALKFTANVRLIEGSEPWGTTFDNGTVTGALGEVIRNKAHIAIGRYYLTLNRNRLADNSAVYYRFAYFFVVSPGSKLSNFEKLLQPFEGAVWILLVITVLIGVFIILSLQFNCFRKLKFFFYGSKVHNSGNHLLNMLIVIFGGTQPKVPQYNFARFLLMMFILLCLVMRSAYQSSLYKFLQSDKRHKNVDSIDDMVEQEYDLYMRPEDLMLFENQPKVAARYDDENFSNFFNLTKSSSEQNSLKIKTATNSTTSHLNPTRKLHSLDRRQASFTPTWRIEKPSLMRCAKRKFTQSISSCTFRRTFI